MDIGSFVERKGRKATMKRKGRLSYSGKRRINHGKAVTVLFQGSLVPYLLPSLSGCYQFRVQPDLHTLHKLYTVSLATAALALSSAKGTRHPAQIFHQPICGLHDAKVPINFN